jgi:hypothetical protein
MTTAYTRSAVVQPKSLGALNRVSIAGTSCQSDTDVEQAESRLAGRADSVAPMATAASESSPQRIATIREQLKLLGDYL